MGREPAGVRVVVTGMGLITPVGLNVAQGWAKVISGHSGIGHISLFPTDDLCVKIAGEAWNFQATDFMPAKEARRADRNVQFALAAAREAMAQAQLPLPLSQDPAIDADEVGVLIGSGAGGIWTYTAQQAVMDRQGPSRLNPLTIPMITVDSASVQVSILAGARGPTFGLASACATGADAVGQAFETIRRGDAGMMITGGTEAAVTRLGIAGFDQLRALSRCNEAPAEACRPFDAGRDRPPARCGRCRGGDLVRDGFARRWYPTDNQLPAARPGMRPGRGAERGAAGRSAVGHVQCLWFWRAQFCFAAAALGSDQPSALRTAV
jgi:3-oxoacyl-[acyl-carrier-protein] synthase II